MQDGGVRCWVVDVISVPNPDPIFRFSLLLYSYIHLSQHHKINLVIDAIDDHRLDWEAAGRICICMPVLTVPQCFCWLYQEGFFADYL